MRLRTGAVPLPQEAPLSPTPPVPISVPTPLPSQPCAPHAALLCRPTRSPPAPRSHALCSAQLCPRALCHLLLPPTTLPINSGARLLPPRLCSPGNSRLQHVEPRGGLGNKPHCGADTLSSGLPAARNQPMAKGNSAALQPRDTPQPWGIQQPQSMLQLLGTAQPWGTAQP